MWKEPRESYTSIHWMSLLAKSLGSCSNLERRSKLISIPLDDWEWYGRLVLPHDGSRYEDVVATKLCAIWPSGMQIKGHKIALGWFFEPLVSNCITLCTEKLYYANMLFQVNKTIKVLQESLSCIYILGFQCYEKKSCHRLITLLITQKS